MHVCMHAGKWYAGCVHHPLGFFPCLSVLFGLASFFLVSRSLGRGRSTLGLGWAGYCFVPSRFFVVLFGLARV